jgi:hypothetical protein
MGDATSELSSGQCGVRWTPPSGTVVQESEHELVVRDESHLIWHATISPRPFAAGDGEDAALLEDMDASARATFDAHWHTKPDRAPDERPRTADAGWSPVIEAVVTNAKGGRCARVIRRMTYEPGDELIAGHVIVPVARGTVELRVVAKADTTGIRETIVSQQRMAAGEPAFAPQAVYDARELDASFPDHPLTIVRATLDRTLRELEVTKPATRQRYATLPAAGCAFVPPPRYVPVVVTTVKGMYMFWRTGLDGWRRMLDVWRLGKIPAPAGDRRLALTEAADQIVRKWESEGASEIEIETVPIGDFGTAQQIEQYVRFRAGGTPRHSLHRWWLDPADMMFRVGVNGPLATDRTALATDLDAVQKTWRPL